MLISFVMGEKKFFPELPEEVLYAVSIYISITARGRPFSYQESPPPRRFVYVFVYDCIGISSGIV